MRNASTVFWVTNNQLSDPNWLVKRENNFQEQI